MIVLLCWDSLGCGHNAFLIGFICFIPPCPSGLFYWHSGGKGLCRCRWSKPEICDWNWSLPNSDKTQQGINHIDLYISCFDVFFDLHLNKRLSKQSWGWWFETLSHPLWRHFNDAWQFYCLFNSYHFKILWHFIYCKLLLPSSSCDEIFRWWLIG